MPKFSFAAKILAFTSILYYYILQLQHFTAITRLILFHKAFRKLSHYHAGHSYAAIMLNLALLPFLSFRYHITIFYTTYILLPSFALINDLS